MTNPFRGMSVEEAIAPFRSLSVPAGAVVQDMAKLAEAFQSFGEAASRLGERIRRAERDRALARGKWNRYMMVAKR